FMVRRAPCSPLFPYTTLFRSELALSGLLQQRLRLFDVLHGLRDRGVVEGQPLPHEVVSHGAEAADRARDHRRPVDDQLHRLADTDRKSTRLNSSHVSISYAVF